MPISFKQAGSLFVAGPNITIFPSGNTFAISASSGSGTIISGTNAGTGIAIFSSASGSNLVFRRILSGSNIGVYTVGNDIIISGASGAINGITGVSNVGTGSILLSSVTAGVLIARTISGSNGIEAVESGSNILVRPLNTTANRLYIASTGGLLMGFIANERPDLFLGIIAQVPFVDICNTMLDEDLPLTVTEIPEWGDIKNDKKSFLYVKSYSPYDNVKKQNYPHMLITGGISDPRVTYWEMTKWVAKLRENKTDNNLLLLHMNMTAGHGGASGRFDYLKEIAMEYGFILKICVVVKSTTLYLSLSFCNNFCSVMVLLFLSSCNKNLTYYFFTL